MTFRPLGILLLTVGALAAQGFGIRTGTTDRSGPCSIEDFIVVNTTNNKYFQCTAGTWVSHTGTPPVGGVSSGDVTGPASSTDNAIALYDGLTGKILKNSAATLPTGSLVGTGQSNTFTTGSQNFSGVSSFVIKTGSNYTPTTLGHIGLDTVALRMKIGLGSTTATLAQLGSGTPATNDCAKFDADGNLVSAGAACSSGGVSGSSLTLGLPIIGQNGTAIAVGTKSGNTTKFVTTTGSLPTNNCAKFDADGNLIDSGGACGGTTVTLTPPYINIGGSLYGPVFQMYDPSLTTFTWVNQSSATLNSVNGAQQLCSPSSGGLVNLNMRVVTPPATPYTVTAAMIVTTPATSYPRAGLMFRESGTNKIVSIASVIGVQFGVDNWTDATNYNSTPAQANWGQSTGLKWFRIQNTGTALNYLVSEDGISFYQVFTSTLTNFFTVGPNQVGFFTNSNSNNAVCSTLLSWQIT